MSTRPTGPDGAFTDSPAPTEPRQQHPQYIAQPQHQAPQPHAGQSRGGDGISAADLMHVAKKEFLTRESKPGLITSEFLSSVVVAIGVLIAAAIVDGTNGFSAKEAWTLVTALSIGYMLSRGLAKSGVRHASKDDDRGL